MPRGEPGDIVVSNLVNRGTVLLNFRIGDVAAMLPYRCACGRSLPLISHVQGRSDDWLELSSGQLVHPHVVLGVFKFDERIWQYQLVQESPVVVTVNIVAAPGLSQQRTTAHLTSALQRVLGRGVEVRIRYVETITRTAAGKVRPIISLSAREGMARLGLPEEAA